MKVGGEFKEINIQREIEEYLSQCEDNLSYSVRTKQIILLLTTQVKK